MNFSRWDRSGILLCWASLLFCDGTGTISWEYFIEPYIFCDVIILFKNVLKQGDIDLKKTNGKENMVALLTKPIGTKEFEEYKRKMSIGTQPIGFSSSGSLLGIVP